MSDLKEGLDRDRYYKNNPIEGQKDMLPELDSYRYKTSEEAKLLPLATQLLRLEHINTQLCQDHNTLLIDAANQQRRAEIAESQHQQDVEKMKRAVEWVKIIKADDWAAPTYEIISILSPDTESDNKSVTK